MHWLLFALSSSFFFTLMNVLQRRIAVKMQNPRSGAILYNLIAAFLAFLLFCIFQYNQPFSLPTNPVAWLLMLGVCVGYGLFERTRFRLASLLDASTYVLIINISVVVSFVGSLIFYQEPLTLTKALGAGLVLFSLFIATYQQKQKHESLQALGLGVLMSAILGGAWIFDKAGIHSFGVTMYSQLVWTIPLIVIWLPGVPIRELVSEWKLGSWKIVLLAALNVLGYWLSLKAYNLAEASRVIPVIQSSILFTVVLSMVFLGERQNIGRKLIAALLTIGGIWLLA